MAPLVAVCPRQNGCPIGLTMVVAAVGSAAVVARPMLPTCPSRAGAARGAFGGWVEFFFRLRPSPPPRPPPNPTTAPRPSYTRSASAKDVGDWFEGCTVAENGVHLTIARNGRPSGEAYVVFATVEDAERAAKKDKEMMGGRWLEIFPATKVKFYAQMSIILSITYQRL